MKSLTNVFLKKIKFFPALLAFVFISYMQALFGAEPSIPPPAFDIVQQPHAFTTQAVALTLLSLMPYIIMILTAFIKIVIVLSLLRNALGAQQAPPNQVLNGVAFLLSLYIMTPTALLMYRNAQATIEAKQPQNLISAESAEYFLAVGQAAKEPYRDFLLRNTIPAHRKLFLQVTKSIFPPDMKEDLEPSDFVVLIPAYISSQLKAAFEIGVLIYIPFFVIDLVTSNILLAMGMMMLSPVTISMPLKLFLLVMLDGWTLLIQGLVATFK